MPSLIRRLLSVATVALPLALGCGDGGSPRAAPSSAPSALAPVEEPAGLGVTIQVRDGAEVWGAARSLAGDRAALLPAGVGALAAFATGLPITTGELFSEHDPIVGAVTGPGLLGGPEAVIAFHVRSADRLISLATQGSSAPFKVRRDPSTGGDLLERVDGEGAELGVFGNHLVIGTNEHALLALGPYVSRNLASLPPSSSDVEVRIRRSLLTVAVPLLRLRAHDSSVGASSALARVVVDGALDRLGDAENAVLTATFGADSASMALVLERKKDAPELAVASGPVASLLALPSSAQIGMVAFDTADGRKADALEISKAAEAYLEASDRAAFDAAFGALTASRGDEMLLGFEVGTLGPAFYGRVAVADRKAADKALADLVAFAGAKTVTDSLGKQGLRISAKETVVEHVGDVVRVRIGASGEPPKTPATDDRLGLVDLLVREQGAALALGSGADAQAALRRMLEGSTLGGDDRVAALVAKLPKTARVAFLADPDRLTRGATRPRSILAVAQGDTTLESRADLILDGSAVRALVELGTR